MRFLAGIIGLFCIAIFQIAPPALAAKIARLGEGALEVRLCPATCSIVNGHPYKKGGRVAIHETRDGWVRVSGFLNAEELKAKFGDAVPNKPALWLPLSSIAGNSAAAQPAPTNDGAEKPATPGSDPIAAEDVKKKVEKKPKRAAGNQRKVTLPKFRPGTAYTRVAEVEPKPEATQSSEQPKEVEVAKPVEPKVQKEADTEQMAKTDDAMEKTAVSEGVAAAGEDVASAAPKKPKPLNVVPEPSPNEEKPVESASVTEEAAPKVDPIKQPEVEVSEEAKPEADPQPEVTEVKKETVEKKVASTEPTFESADSDPLVTEERPKTYIKALKDKRLKKLPGSKTKGYNTEEVIALRHHALMLLKNNECKGILDGGRSRSQKGWLYVICSDDPTYLRQFPLEEASW